MICANDCDGVFWGNPWQGDATAWRCLSGSDYLVATATSGTIPPKLKHNQLHLMTLRKEIRRVIAA